jgi:PAS domain S-box-containing protein
MTIAEVAERIVRDGPDGVLVADAKGVIRLWNGGCERIFGYTEAEAVGRSLDLIIPEPLRARHWEGFSRTMATGQSRYGAGDVLSVPALRKDGTRISAEFSVIPFRDEKGAISGIGAILRDTTKRFEEMKALRRATGKE